MPATETLGRTKGTAIARLAELGTELTRLGWDTSLIGDMGPLPALLIRTTAPGAPALAEHIYAVEMGRRWFYWWSRSCGADPAKAAVIITDAMRPAR